VSFQLVSASDDEIIIWHTEHGHIYFYVIEPKAHDLKIRWCRNIPEATQDAESLQQDAYVFATEQARIRHLLG
jgi:hypothetical protein